MQKGKRNKKGRERTKVERERERERERCSENEEILKCVVAHNRV